MIELWNSISNIGLKSDLNIFERRKIRIINQTILQVIICCVFIIIFSFIKDYTNFVWISALTILISFVPITINYFHKYNLSKISFIIIFFSIELIVARVIGEASYIEFCILLLPVSAILLFTKDYFTINTFLGIIGIGGFFLCEFIYAYTDPIIILPNPFAYKIITGVTLCLTIFQNVRFFKLDLLEIEKLNQAQNKSLQRKQKLIKEQNQSLRQINQKILSEIDAKKRAEKRLLAANEELQQFASVASHDMKEPLRTISSFSSLLARRIPVDKNAQEYLFFIKDATERMARLLDDLITFARAGKGTETLDTINLNDVLLMVKNNLHTTIAQENAIIQYDELPKIEGHFTPFIQLFQNLIANSIKYQKVGHQARIKISCQSLEQSYLIKITDNGIGMKPEYLERIFAPFTRLHTQQEYKGSGIGLATCKKIVQRYNGEISVESELDIGTTFYIHLPKKQEEQNAFGAHKDVEIKNEALMLHSQIPS